jgi:glycosyltransferase involved in cell wall biosynthesis
MRFMLLTPGTGHFYCGSCLRDHALGNALQRLGHEVSVIPLYLPLVLEATPSEAPENPVHMGGINMYLQQKSRLAGKLPRFLTNLLDRPGLLRWVSKRGSLTEAPDLGAMTLSMLKGEDGHQNTEVEKLVEWAASEKKPDVIVISNLLLSGVVRRLKQELDRPVVASMQGEAPFLDSLPDSFSQQSWSQLSERAKEIDALVPVSRDYGDLMRSRLGLDEARVHVVHNGLDLADLTEEPPPLLGRSPKTIGYLARMCRDKGLPTLIEAFVILKQRGRIPNLRLRVCGVMLNEDRPLVEELQQHLSSNGTGGDVEFLPNVARGDKIEFLRSLSVLSVPATYGESFGLYLLEAMVCGVPVVQPRHAAFPEILEATGGGILCEPDDATSLADGLEELLLDEPRSQQLASAGRRSVLDHFNSDRMAREFATICQTISQPHVE